MKVCLRTLAVSVIGSMLTRIFIVIGLLTCTSEAAIQPSETRLDWQDLEVITL
jgi:hypothetical protein